MYDDVRIVGVGETDYSSDSGRSELALAVHAIRAAADEAGIDVREIDGLCTYVQDTNPEIEVARTLGMRQLRFHARAQYGGGDCCSTVMHAAMAIQCGVADTVAVFRAFNERSGFRYGGGYSGLVPEPDADHAQYSWGLPMGLFNAAGWIGMIARRYMHETGATSEDFGRVSVTSRAHAATNPRARFHNRTITMEDHQSSRLIVEPLRLLDCCLETDGGTALILTRADRSSDCRGPAVPILGAAQGVGFNQHLLMQYYRPDMLDFDELRVVREQLWNQSGLGADDVDTAILYDHFTPFVLIQLEGWGFCGRGEAAAMVRDGATGLGGHLPVNPHGGQLGEAYMHGMNGIVEAVRQARGDACNQVTGAQVVLATGAPALATSALLLGTPDAG